MRTINKEDFKLFDIKGHKFVYLTERQSVMEITTPSLKAYFDVANGDNVDCVLDKGFANALTSELAKFSSYGNDIETRPTEQVMLTLNTTHGCNMACKYCFASTVSEKKNVMPLETATRAICNMLEKNPQAFQYFLYFFGGEPLLHKDFIYKVCNTAKRIFANRKDKQLAFLLNTNGTLLDDSDFLSFLKEYNFSVTVSIDGNERTNDANRILANGKGSFRKIMKGVGMLKQYGVCHNLRATFSPQNEDLYETIRFFEELAIPYSYAFTISAANKETARTCFSEDDTKRLASQWRLATEYLFARMTKGQPIYNMDVAKRLHAIENNSRRTYGCEAGRSALIVDENGDYYTCQNILPFSPTKIGNLRDGIDANKRKLYRSHNLSELKNCKKCWARYLCGGGCEVERFFRHNDHAQGINQRCKITQIEWENSIELYINKIINKLN